MENKVCPAISASNCIVYCNKDGNCQECDLPQKMAELEK